MEHFLTWLWLKRERSSVTMTALLASMVSSLVFIRGQGPSLRPADGAVSPPECIPSRCSSSPRHTCNCSPKPSTTDVGLVSFSLRGEGPGNRLGLHITRTLDRTCPGEAAPAPGQRGHSSYPSPKLPTALTRAAPCLLYGLKATIWNTGFHSNTLQRNLIWRPVSACWVEKTNRPVTRCSCVLWRRGCR